MISGDLWIVEGHFSQMLFLFFPGCAGSFLLLVGVFSSFGKQVSHWDGFSSCGEQILGMWAQQLWPTRA